MNCASYPRHSNMIGQTISHYRILEHLSGGGMGVVYKAEDTRLKRTVALKFLPPELTRDPEARERFVHEAQAASALQHVNICVVHDIDQTEDGQMFISMEYIEGETLRKKLERGPLKIEEAIRIALEVAQGLAKAHEHGIVHRDIKPANILMSADGIVKIVDFGLAKLSGRTALTRAGSTMGTAAYMSPEQAQGETADTRTDIWSLGVVLYEMLAGKPPFTAEYENALLYSIINADPEPVTGLRTGIPLELEHILGKCLRKFPDERYQHADELAVDLTSLRHTLPAGEQGAAKEPSRAARRRPPRDRRMPPTLISCTSLLPQRSFLPQSIRAAHETYQRRSCMSSLPADRREGRTRAASVRAAQGEWGRISSFGPILRLDIPGAPPDR